MKYIFSLCLYICSTLIFCSFAQKSTDISKIVEMKNIHKVDEDLYRSSQPNKEEFRELEKAGITEVLNLRRLHSDNNEAVGTDIKLHWVKSNAGILREKHLLNALRIIKNREGNMLVHCKHGSDRTGAVIAMYRIVFQNWTKEDAIDEMKNGDYGFHRIYFNISRLIMSIDIDNFKKKLFEDER